MQTVSLLAHFDGKQIILDEPFPIAINARLLVTVLSEGVAEHAMNGDAVMPTA